MKRWRSILAILFFLGFIAGCIGPIDVYQAATDERKLGTFVDDAVIRRKIQGAILSHDDKTIRKAVISLSVSVHRGRVVLVAELADPKVGGECIKIARSTEGVIKVNSYFLPEREGWVDDTKIQARVKARFLKDSELKGFQVEVTCIQGHVVLAGLVADRYSRNKCIKLAKEVEGVVKVVDFIQIM